jgi:hypothetical protein
MELSPLVRRRLGRAVSLFRPQRTFLSAFIGVHLRLIYMYGHST